MAPDGSTLQALAGKVPDAEAAARADVSLEQVRAYRRFHRIPPFVRTPPPPPTTSPPPTAARVASPARVPAARVSAPRAPAKPTPRSVAYSVTVSRGQVRATFVTVASDMIRAIGRARAALDRRSDGPWVIEELAALGPAIDS